MSDRPNVVIIRFLAWISFGEPHNPYQVPEPYYSLFPLEKVPPPLTDESALSTKGAKFQWCRQSFERAFPGFGKQIPRARANYYLGMLRLIDDQVKRLAELLAWTLRAQDPLPFPRRRYVMKRHPHNYWC